MEGIWNGWRISRSDTETHPAKQKGIAQTRNMQKAIQFKLCVARIAGIVDVRHTGIRPSDGVSLRGIIAGLIITAQMERKRMDESW